MGRRAVSSTARGGGSARSGRTAWHQSVRCTAGHSPRPNEQNGRSRVRDTFVGVPHLGWLWWKSGCNRYNQARGAHDRAIATGAGGRAGPAVRAARCCRGFPAGGGERELPEVREAELRVRCPGSSGPRPPLPVDQVGGPPEEGWPAARGRGGRQGALRDRPACGVHAGCRAGHRGERADLRGPPGGGQRRRRRSLRDGRGEGGSAPRSRRRRPPG